MPEGFTGTVYTCPMHPEVRKAGPGSCPLCGMGLEVEAVSVADDEGPNPELVDFTWRFWVGVVLTVPLLVLSMSPFIGIHGLREFFGERTTLWIELVLGTPAILWVGWPFLERGYQSFRTMNLNMFSLIADPKDIMPYLESLVPCLRQALVDPIPDVRAVAARAMGALVDGLGEGEFVETLAWLQELIHSDLSAVERSGGAQGLAYVLVAMGEPRLSQLLRELMPLADHPKCVRWLAVCCAVLCLCVWLCVWQCVCVACTLVPG